MAKNNNLAELAASPIKITSDIYFKDIIRFKAIAAIVLQATIPEFKKKTLIEIARAIINFDKKHKTNQTDAEVLDDEVDFLNSQAGVGDEKQTISDVIFKVSIDEKEIPISISQLTVNLEMQNKITGLGYDIISRAVYYCASLLRDTVSAGDTKYTGIHRVYTVWLCNENLPKLRPDAIKDRYLHKYQLYRCYDGYDRAYSDESADLMRIVMVELPKLVEQSGEGAELLCKLFTDTKNIVAEVEKVAGVKLAKARKGVGNMIHYEGLLQEKDEVIQEKDEIIQEQKTVIQEQETKLKEKGIEGIRDLVEACHSFGKGPTEARLYIRNKRPDADTTLLDEIIAEEYGL